MIARGALTAALRRVSVMSEERNKPVQASCSRRGMLKLTANSPDYGEAEEQMDGAVRG